MRWSVVGISMRISHDCIFTYKLRKSPQPATYTYYCYESNFISHIPLRIFGCKIKQPNTPSARERAHLQQVCVQHIINISPPVSSTHARTLAV